MCSIKAAVQPRNDSDSSRTWRGHIVLKIKERFERHKCKKFEALCEDIARKRHHGEK